MLQRFMFNRLLNTIMLNEVISNYNSSQIFLQIPDDKISSLFLYLHLGIKILKSNYFLLLIDTKKI